MTAPHKLTAAMRQHKPKLRSTKTHAPNLLRPTTQTTQRSVRRRTSASTAARNASAASKISACRNKLRNALSTLPADGNNPPSHTCRTRAPISVSAPRHRPGITSIPAAPPGATTGTAGFADRHRRATNPVRAAHVSGQAMSRLRQAAHHAYKVRCPARTTPSTRIKRTPASDCATCYKYSSNNPSGRENSTSRRSMSSATIISSTAGT